MSSQNIDVNKGIHSPLVVEKLLIPSQVQIISPPNEAKQFVSAASHGPEDLEIDLKPKRKYSGNMQRLPTGVTISSNGYVQLRIMVKGNLYCRNFGKDSALARQVASIHLSEKRKEILMGKFSIDLPLPKKNFKEVAEIYFERWSNQKDPNGRIKHNDGSKYTCRNILDNWLISYFGEMNFDEIKPRHVQDWRDHCTQHVKGTSANRFQATLSSIFNHVNNWVKTETIPAFKLPIDNPVKPIEKAKSEKRTRILTKYEAQKLKFAFQQLHDEDGWDICKLALKSVLSMKDLRKLEIGQTIDIQRAKTGVPINIPITVLVQLNWKNWRKRWEAARKEAGLATEDRSTNVEFRDLRKTGINWLKGKFDLKLVSEFAGHADVKTTESFYMVDEAEKLKPLAEELSRQVDQL